MPGTRRQILLSDTVAGEDSTVLSFQGGRGVISRLAALGFTPGVKVSTIQNYGRGPLIVTVRGTRVALGRGEASKIIVERDTHE
jgi:ferrous iron transport protein A